MLPRITCSSICCSLLVFACISPVTHLKGERLQWSIGYWSGTSSVPISSLDWGALTDVVHVAIGPNADGSLTYSCSWATCSASDFAREANAIVRAGHAHHRKVSVMVSANNYPDANFI